MEPKVKVEVVTSRPTKLHIFGYVFLALLLILGIWYAKNRHVQNVVSGVVSPPSEVLKINDGRTNIVLLGIGGEGHEGGDLTDSILFVSFNLIDNTADMIAIPRDIWIPSMQAKVNTAYHYGNERREGGGRDLAKSAVSELLGVPVHYAVTLDFQGFVKAINAVGGLDVVVDQTFDDYEYPIPGQENAEPVTARYEHIHFDAGMTHMDGTTALKFARSRHAQGDEGTDFARGVRQQKIILAFRSKLFSTGTIFNSEIMGKLKESFSSSVDTDILAKEQASFLKVFLGLGNKNNISSIELTDYLANPKSTKIYGGQWVLIPTPSLVDLQSYVKAKLAE